jgi:dipeptidyl aminopeptidase/acylaminoacyl peptidase
MRVARWIAVAFLLLVVLFQARRAVLVALGEYRSLHPVRTTPERPADADALRLEDVRFVAGADTIRGWFVRGESGAVVIAAHGGGADRRQMLPIARVLQPGGLGVLLFDWPGHGTSDGRVAYGLGERRALGAAIDYLVSRPDVDGGRIGLYGFSLGAYIALQVAADDARVAALAVLAAPTDLREQGRYEYRNAGPVGRWAARTVLRLSGVDVESHRPIDVVARIAPRPFLVVQGDADAGVPVTMARELHARAGGRSELWIIRDGVHREILGTEPQYGDRLRAFFADALLGSSAGSNRAVPAP